MTTGVQCIESDDILVMDDLRVFVGDRGQSSCTEHRSILPLASVHTSSLQ